MPNLFEDLIPTESQPDNLFGDLIPAGQSVKRVPVLGIDPTEHEELDVAVSAWDRSKFASGQLVRGLSTAIAGLPEAISIGAAALEKKYPIGAATIGAPTDPEQTWTGTLARWIKGAGEFVAPDVSEAKAKAMQDDFWTSKVSGGVGSAVGFMAGGGLVKKGAQKLIRGAVPASATIATMGAGAGATQGWHDAKAHGATDEEAIQSYVLNGFVGTSEAIPLSGMLNRLNKASGGSLMNIMMRVGAETVEEAFQEAMQSAAGDVIAANIVEYDPDREMFDQLGTDAAAGGVTGGLLSLATSVLNKKLARRGATPYQQKEKLLARDPWTDEKAGDLINSREELQGLKGHDGRVVFFERVPSAKEGQVQESSIEYIKIGTGTDPTSAIIAHEQANPNSLYKGVFDLGKVDAGSITVGDSVFETKEEAVDAAAKAEAEGNKEQAEEILGAALTAETIENRMEVEAKYLGEGVLDPVRLGKHRIKAKEVQQVLPGDVEETDNGYQVTLKSGIKLEMDFTKIPEGMDIDVESYLSETGMERREWEKLTQEEQQERLANAQVVGAFTKNSVIDTDGNRVEMPDSYIMMFGAGADIGTFKHEAIHFLRETGLMTEKEFQTLVNKYSSPDRDDTRQEEDVARAYEGFMQTPGASDGIFQRVLDVFQGVLMVRSAAGMLNRINRGEIAGREKPVLEDATAEPVQVKQAVRNLGTAKFREGEPLDIERSGKRGQVTIKDVGKALETYSRETTDEVFTVDTDPERVMAQAIINASDEVTYQLQQPDSGVDWYEKDLRFTEKSLQLAYPELKNKPHLVLFKGLMAPTSFGNNPVTNLMAASRVYEAGKGDFTNMPGRQPDGRGWTMRANATDQMINRMNQLVRDKGVKGASKWLLSEHPLKEIRQYHPSAKGKADDSYYGAYVFGPKGGDFFLNNNGISKELTVDMWFTRAWNRTMGTILDEAGDVVDSPTDRQRVLMDQVIESVASDLDLTVSEFQAVWWYYEQQLWKALGASVESYSFANGARRLLEQKGIQPPRVARGRDAAAKRRQAAVDAAVSRGARKGQGEPVVAPRQSVRVSPKARERINVIEGYESIEAEGVEAQNNKTITELQKRHMGRKSRQLVYFGGQATLRAKQQLELDEAYAARAVRKQVEELQNKLVKDAWDSQTGQKLPKIFRVGKWAKRLKKFYKLALPIAAHLNTTGKNKDGTFNYADFEMRAGLMPIKEFKKQDYNVGDTILVKDEITGEIDELTIGPYIVANGRQGHQLIRKVAAEQQGEIYDHFAEEFPDLIWAVDMFIDPALKDTRTVINGVEVPAFNRFSLAGMMTEGDTEFEGLAGYTPDVIISRSLLGALKGVFNPKAGTRSPGRKYKTGTGREGELNVETEEDEETGKPVFAGYTRKGGDLQGLFEGFTIRGFQAIREKARKEYAENIIRTAGKPIDKKVGLLPGHVTYSTGIGMVWDTIKAFRNFESLEADSEIQKRLSEKGGIDGYSKFIGEALALRGKTYQINEDVIRLLQNGFAADKVHGRLYQMGAWAIRNSTQTLLAHPFTYMVNVLSNDVFTAEAIAKNTISGMLKLASTKGKLGADDLRFAKNLFTAQFYKFAGVRKMVGWKTDFDQFTEEVMPDDVFEGSTALEDLKVQHHIKPWEYLRQGEFGAAALQLIQYGNVDLRAKQRSAYAFLKSKAVRAAKARGLSGEAMKREVASYMARPPKLDRVQALELANFDYLNYADSPDVLQRFASNDYSRLIIPFPRFGYHYMAKQIERVSAVKVLMGKVPKGKRADAFADLVTFGLFTAGAGGWLLDKVLRGGDDDEEARGRIGTATYKYFDEVTGEMKSKRLNRELITANRVNLSEYARLLGIDDDDDSDFWWRARQFPPVIMGGALILAEQDAKAGGVSSGVKTYFSQGADLAKDFFTLGGGIKVLEKVYRAATTEPGDKPEAMITDPYATNVPLTFYVTDQVMTTLVPGRRQFDDVMMMIDPTSRRKTAAKPLSYDPGAWDAIKLGHVSGVVNRILNKAGLTEEPMAQGTLKRISTKPRTKETKALKREALRIIAENKNRNRLGEASYFRNSQGNLQLGLIPEATRTYQPREMQMLKLGGFNIRQFPQASYEEALQPPKR